MESESSIKPAVTLFNHYYAALLRDVKAHGVGRGAIKKSYHRFDHADEGHVTKWTAWTAPLVERMASEGASVDETLKDETLAEDTLLFEGIYLEQVLSSGVPRGALVQALLSLAVAARLHQIEASPEAVAEARKRLLDAASNAEAEAEAQAEPSAEAEAKAEPSAEAEPSTDTDSKEKPKSGGDDRIDALVRAARASALLHRPPTASDMPSLPPGIAESLRKMENTKIGRMAREISESLGADAISDPGSLAAVIGKVGGVMQAKMQSGELNHGELLSEAMGMIGSLPSLFQAAAGGAEGAAEGGAPPLFPGMPAGMPDMAEMLKKVMAGFGGMGQGAQGAAAASKPRGAAAERDSSARTRLAAKLAARSGPTKG